MRKIRWGVLGTAHIAEGQTIPGMQNTKNCELYAIAGRSLEKAKEFQALWIPKEEAYFEKFQIINGAIEIMWNLKIEK